MVLGNDEVELRLEVLGIRGEFRDDVLKDCDFLAGLPGMLTKVPSRRKNWSVSTFAMSTEPESKQPSYSEWLKSGSKEVAQRN